MPQFSVPETVTVSVKLVKVWTKAAPDCTSMKYSVAVIELAVIAVFKQRLSDTTSTKSIVLVDTVSAFGSKIFSDEDT